MKQFYFDQDLQSFGIKDKNKFLLIKAGVINVNITGNKATVYTQSEVLNYTMVDTNTGDYKLSNISI